jgi:peptidoglycan hydrolase CwlO-like protein
MYEIDNGREYQLEQPTTLMSTKNYKEKLVDTFIKKLKQLVCTVYSKYADLKLKIRRLEFEMETISKNVADLRRQIKEKDAFISILQVKADNYDKIAEYLTPEQIDEMIKEVEEVRRMHKQQREMNKYYEELRKR